MNMICHNWNQLMRASSLHVASDGVRERLAMFMSRTNVPLGWSVLSGNPVRVTLLLFIVIGIFYLISLKNESSTLSPTLEPDYQAPSTRVASTNGSRDIACPGILSIISKGRLGNQMSQYAALLEIAARNGLSPVLASGDMELIRRTFVMRERPTSYPLSEVKNYRVFRARHNKYGYDGRTGDLRTHMRLGCKKQAQVRLEGYFQVSTLYAGDNYFRENDSLIKKEFTPREKYQQEVEAFMRSVLVTSRPLNHVVGIHIRRGDFNRRNKTLHFSYYIYSMNFIENLFGGNVFFFIATDSPNWAKLLVQVTNMSRVVISPYTDYAYDFTLLYLCDHVILSAGTFSWWAGYLTKGVKIIPYKLKEDRPNWIHLQPSLYNRTTWFQ